MFSFGLALFCFVCIDQEHSCWGWPLARPAGITSVGIQEMKTLQAMPRGHPGLLATSRMPTHRGAQGELMRVVLKLECASVTLGGAGKAQSAGPHHSGSLTQD